MRTTLTAVLLGGVCACSAAKDPRVEPAPAPTEPVKVPVDRWTVGAVDAAAAARIEEALASGAFRAPADGQSYLGVSFNAVAPDGNGALPLSGAAYVFAEVQAGAAERFFVRPDHAQLVGTVPGASGHGAVLQPGDPYGSGRSRVPLRVSPGRNLVVALCLPGCAIEVFRTGAEVELDTADVTAPDLIAGGADVQWVGLPLLALGDRPLGSLAARVLESPVLRATERVHVALVPGAASQVAFELAPRTTWPAGVKSVPVTLQIASPDLTSSYERTIEVPVAQPGTLHHRTRISGADGSVQYYAVLPPSAQTEEKPGLILSLHGAAVDAIGQAASYSPKDWAYVVAPTNRRPYGFDWEEWGRVDAVEALADAMEALPVDPGRVHLTGHSMGGHGTWHVGVHFSPRFGLIGASAGWISFGTYGGSAPEPLPVLIARGASDTLRYVQNLRGHTVYVIHGTADDNVPISQAVTMLDALAPIVDDLQHHFQEGAGHWWDADPDEPGADCVDWEPMIALMKAIRFDPMPLSFDHRIVSPWVNPTHSFVTVRSELDPGDDVLLHVRPGPEGEVVVDTENARSLVLDGARLAERGIRTALVNGTPYEVGGGPVPVGPQDGKTETVHGPFNQVFQRPFCFVWPDDSAAFREAAAYLASSWNVIGNGLSCGLPLSRLTDAIAAERNLIWMGVPREQVRGAGAVPIEWDERGIRVDGTAVGPGVLEFVFPADGRLNAVMTATPGYERHLRLLTPFSSRSGMPDFAAIGTGASGLAYTALGYFTPDWKGIDRRNSTY